MQQQQQQLCLSRRRVAVSERDRVALGLLILDADIVVISSGTPDSIRSFAGSATVHHRRPTDHWRSRLQWRRSKNSAGGLKGFEGETCWGRILAKALIGYWNIIRQHLHYNNIQFAVRSLRMYITYIYFYFSLANIETESKSNQTV